MSFNYTKPSEVATGGLVYKGTFDASTGLPDLSNAEQGDLYVISVGGTIYGQTWSVGDHLLINEDMGGSITNSKIDKVDNTDLVTSVNGQTGPVVLSGDDIAADHTASNYTATNANIDGHLSGIDSALGVATPDATDSVKGLIEISTNAEATAGTATDKALVPSNISSFSIASSQVTGLATVATSGAYSDLSGKPTTATTTSEGIIEISTNAEATAGTATDKALVPSNISSISVGQLSDIDLTGISNTELLAYNSTSGNFEPTSPTSVPDATDSVKGIIEISTNAEATTGTATDKALVPSNISSFSIASSQVTGLATVATSGAYADLSGKLTTATTTSEGILETATDAETTTGTATDKALTPANIDAIGVGQLSNVNLSGVAANDFLKYSGSEFEPTTDGTALTIEVVSDTTPQLGGNLDVQTNEIVSVSNNDIVIAPHGTGSIVVKDEKSIKFNESTNTYSVSIAAPNTLAASYSLTWPLNDGDAGQLLQTNGSGVTSWTGPHLLAASNLSDLADAATARGNLSAQQQDAGLDSIAALTTAADKMIYTTASDTYDVTDLTAAGRAILDDATAADQRTTLGLAAVASSGNAVDVTSAVNPTNYTKASNDVDGHLSGIDSKLGTILTLPTYSSITNASSPVTGAINYHYSADTSGGAITINLPAISGATTGQRIYIKLKTAGNDLTLTPDSTVPDTIDGQSSYILDVQHSAITLVVGAGSNWEVI